MGVVFGEPWITRRIEMIDEKSTPFLHRIHGNGSISRAARGSAKGVGMVGIGFGTDEFAISGAAPEICAAGMEESASEGAEGLDELAGIAALKRGARKLQQKFLESLLRLRRVDRTRVSVK